MVRPSHALLALVAITCLGCHDNMTCPAILVSRVIPREVTIDVGQTVVAQYQEDFSCSSGKQDFRTVSTVWTSADTAVISLEPNGRITARATGNAAVTPESIGALGTVTVHVR